jgi:hypothetical protein
MFENPLYNIPLEKVLGALGSRPGKEKNMWISPMRDEHKASLHVNPAKNVWYDFGITRGGTNVDLVMLVKRCTQREAYRFLAKLAPELLRAGASIQKPEEQKPSTYIKAAREIQNRYLIQYLEGRKIPLALARRYLKEIVLFDPSKNLHYTLLGIPNNAGAYALRGPNGFKGTNKAGITTINKQGKFTSKPSTGKVAVFEGMFDFLSWRVMQSSELPTCDVVILNSTNNLQRAADYIRQHDSATCFLDNDPAGERCYQGIRDMMNGKEVLDMSDLYGAHKDLNEMLQSSRGYSANMKLSPAL